MKICSKCKKNKPKTEFGSLPSKKGGLHSWCKLCLNEARRKYYYANREMQIQKTRDWENKQENFKEKKNEQQKKRYRANPEKHAARERQYKNKKPWRYLLYNARRRAVAKNLPINITEEYVKELFDACNGICPILGIKMETHTGKVQDNSYTLDRVIPEKGYVKGNVAIISHRANSIKRDANLKELIQLVKWMKEYYE